MTNTPPAATVCSAVDGNGIQLQLPGTRRALNPLLCAHLRPFSNRAGTAILVLRAQFKKLLLGILFRRRRRRHSSLGRRLGYNHARRVWGLVLSTALHAVTDLAANRVEMGGSSLPAGN